MQRDSHDACGLLAIRIEAVELIHQHTLILFAGISHPVDQGHVVNIHSIRHGEHLSLLYFHWKRLVVAVPIADVDHFFLGKQIKSVESLNKTGSEPPAGTLARRTLDGSQRGLDDVAFVALGNIGEVPAVGNAVAHHFPASSLHLFHSFWEYLAYHRIQRNGRLHSSRIEGVRNSP